jgi:hypothetical protein
MCVLLGEDKNKAERANRGVKCKEKKNKRAEVKEPEAPPPAV